VLRFSFGNPGQPISTAIALGEKFMTDHSQRGAGKFKAIVVTLILAAIGYTLFQVAPAYMDNYWLQQAMVDEARVAAVNHKSDEEIREVIWKVVLEQKIKATPPLRREDIKVEWMGRGVNISLSYTIPVDLAVYQFTLKFTPNAGDRPII
jgi:hypothetical protein